LTDAVRSFTALIAIEGSHPQLLPDLTAWVDLETPPLAATSEVPVP
jgi:hypothetical protein